MSRADSPYIVGDFWLDKRRGGRSPDIWQIACKSANGRTIDYRSTRRSDLEEAKAHISAFVLGLTIRAPQENSEANVFLLLKLYWNEHGRNVVSPSQIACTIRAFAGFLISQPDLTIGATVDMLTPAVFERFRIWRMAPHEYEVTFDGKTTRNKSKGVNGESLQRNLDDVRAALRHHERNGRIRAPIVPSVASQYRSPARDRLLSMEELGAMFGYAQSFPPLYRWMALMLATAVRPEAGMAFNPAKQAREGAVDLHPHGWPITKKVNPVVPAIPALRALLDTWPADDAVTSRRTAWRTMRRVLELSDDVHAKTIRHTVATMLLDDERVIPAHIEALLGHANMHRTTRVYAKWNVRHMAPLIPALTDIWEAVHQSANDWSAVHLLCKTKKGKRELS